MHPKIKKSLSRHLRFIYVTYFLALAFGLTLSLISAFSSIRHNSQDTAGDRRNYSVEARIDPKQIDIEGLPENATFEIQTALINVTLDEKQSIGNSFKVLANSNTAYFLLMLNGGMSIAIFVLIALIIKSLRKSINEESIIPKIDITRTRIIGILLIAIECGSMAITHINQLEAQRLLADTSLHVSMNFNVNFIMGILIIFMAEVFSISSQLSEEQKLTI